MRAARQSAIFYLATRGNCPESHLHPRIRRTTREAWLRLESFEVYSSHSGHRRARVRGRGNADDELAGNPSRDGIIFNS